MKYIWQWSREKGINEIDGFGWLGTLICKFMLEIGLGCISEI
jgi:hypothetical protein